MEARRSGRRNVRHGAPPQDAVRRNAGESLPSFDYDFVDDRIRDAQADGERMAVRLVSPSPGPRSSSPRLRFTLGQTWHRRRGRVPHSNEGKVDMRNRSMSPFRRADGDRVRVRQPKRLLPLVVTNMRIRRLFRRPRTRTGTAAIRDDAGASAIRNIRLVPVGRLCGGFARAVGASKAAPRLPRLVVRSAGDRRAAIRNSAFALAEAGRSPETRAPRSIALKANTTAPRRRGAKTEGSAHVANDPIFPARRDRRDRVDAPSRKPPTPPIARNMRGWRCTNSP